MAKQQESTFESEALAVLAYEFPTSDSKKSDAKIEARLRRKKLGPYDPARVAILRALKDDLQREIGKCDASQYFTERHGHYVEIEDFDVPRLTEDMAKRYPTVSKRVLESFVPFCVFIYYLL